MVTLGAERTAVAHAMETFSVSQRGARRAIGAERSTMRDLHHRPAIAGIRAWLRESATMGRRFGYRSLQILLRPEGTHMNGSTGA